MCSPLLEAPVSITPGVLLQQPLPRAASESGFSVLSPAELASSGPSQGFQRQLLRV